MANDPSRRILVDLYQRTQKTRIQFGNRVAAIENGKDVADEHTLDILTRYQARFEELEKEARNDLHDLVVGDELVERLTEVKGIGLTLAAQMTAMIDVSKDPYVSCLWRYAGFAVTGEGKAERPKKGEKLHYNNRLKTVMFNVLMSFLKSHSPYADLYYTAIEFYQANRTEWTLAHCKAAARRKTIKVFLQHYWLVARTINGLPVTEPYVQGKLGHNHIYRPQQFGWSDFGEG